MQSELGNYFMGSWMVKTHGFINSSCLKSITHAVRFSLSYNFAICLINHGDMTEYSEVTATQVWSFAVLIT